MAFRLCGFTNRQMVIDRICDGLKIDNVWVI